MRWTKVYIAVFASVTSVLIGCGAPGVPVPPSLEVARPVTDLHATRKGDSVYLTWTMPTHTTDRQNLRHAGTIVVCRAIGQAGKDCPTPVARIPFQPSSRNAAPQSETYTDHVDTSNAAPVANFAYAISVLNRYGRSAGFSNQAEVPAAPTLQPPTDFHAQLDADGVHLLWNAVKPPDISGVRFFYRIYRRDAATRQDTIAGEVTVGVPSPSSVDHSFEWERTYDYRATAVTVVNPPGRSEEQVEGEDTPSVRVVTHDVFAPATPTGLQAVFSGPGQQSFIDLVWAPDIEPDLAGYNVYRHEAGGPPSKLNPDLIKSPAYRDTAVMPGHKYFYSVSAMDVRGNESPRSDETSETVPEQ
jgi:hypothetical protein